MSPGMYQLTTPNDKATPIRKDSYVAEDDIKNIGNFEVKAYPNPFNSKTIIVHFGDIMIVLTQII